MEAGDEKALDHEMTRTAAARLEAIRRGVDRLIDEGEFWSLVDQERLEGRSEPMPTQ